MNNLDERLKQLLDEKVNMEQTLNEISVLIDAYNRAITDAKAKEEKANANANKQEEG